MVQAAPVGLPPKKDYINFGADQVLMQLIGGGMSIPSLLLMSHINDLFLFIDTLIYACMLKKINQFEWSQERMMAITNNAIFNIHKKKIKRVI